jgi:hypothetical protein
VDGAAVVRAAPLLARVINVVRPRSDLIAMLTPYTPEGGRCRADTGRCDFWNRGPGAVRPACCTDHLLEMAVFLRDLFARRGITCWLDYGMLLGAVRSGRMIPWDEDGDFGFLADDRDRVLGLREEVEAAGYVFDLSRPSIICIRYSRTNSIQIDLYGWRREAGRLALDVDWYAWPGMADREWFPLSYVQPMETVALEGEPFPAPSPTDRFLVEHRYGADYMTPSRPPARRRLAVPDVSEAELTPDVQSLLAELERLEKMVDSAYFGSLSGLSPFAERWIAAGFPVRPRGRVVAERWAALSETDRNAATETLLGSIEMLGRALDEHGQRSLSGVATRIARRTVRALRP